MLELRPRILDHLTPLVLERIRKEPKPTTIAEAIVVVKHFDGMALNLDEIAEIINIADPGRSKKARASDYDLNELDKHDTIRLIKTPNETLVRYVDVAPH